jgi:hypothetical protein
MPSSFKVRGHFCLYKGKLCKLCNKDVIDLRKKNGGNFGKDINISNH